MRSLRTALACLAVSSVACGGAAEQWAALEAEGLPGGPDDAPLPPIDDDGGDARLDEIEDDGPPDGSRSERSARRTAKRAEAAHRPPRAAVAEPVRRLERRLSFVSWSARGLEARLVAQGVRERQGGLLECMRSAGTEDALATVSLRFAKGASTPTVEARAERGGDLQACMATRLGDLRLEQPSESDGELVAVVRIVTPREADDRLPPLGETEELVVNGGRCLARERFTCKKPANCAATSEHEIRCPEEHGLAPVLEPDEATERIELGVSGGKPGDGTHSLVYAFAAGRCSLTRIVDEPSREPPVRARETIDATCASFARARSLYDGKLADRKPKAAAASHPVRKSAVHWKKRGAGEKPAQRSTAWSGPSEDADESYDELRKLVVAAGRGAAKVRSARLDD